MFEHTDRRRVEEFHNRLNKIEKRINTLNEKFSYYLDLSMKEYGESKDMYLELSFKVEKTVQLLNRATRKWGRLIQAYYGIKMDEIKSMYLSYVIVNGGIDSNNNLQREIMKNISQQDRLTLNGIGNYLKDYSKLESHI